MSLKEFVFKVKEFCKKHWKFVVVGLAVFMFLVIAPPLCGCQGGDEPTNSGVVVGTYMVTEGFREVTPDGELTVCEDIQGAIFTVNQNGNIISALGCIDVGVENDDGVTELECSNDYMYLFYGIGIHQHIEGSMGFFEGTAVVRVEITADAPKVSDGWTEVYDFSAKLTSLPW